MTDGNGVSSYQKNGVTNGANGSNGHTNGSSPPRSGLLGGWKKWAVGAGLVALLATIYSFESSGRPDPQATKMAVEKEMTASDLSFDKNGKLKLFDSFSK